jgi:hypothetical protein
MGGLVGEERLTRRDQERFAVAAGIGAQWAG